MHRYSVHLFFCCTFASDLTNGATYNPKQQRLKHISGRCVRGWLVYKRDQDEIISAKRIGASDALMQRCDIY